jgi:PST family polysaccharide transporter
MSPEGTDRNGSQAAGEGAPESLRRSAARGIGWTTLQAIGSRLIAVAVFVALARLLSPDDFGLVSLAYIFVSLLQVFVDQGFGQAIIQRPELEPGHLSSAFWGCLGFGVVLTAVAVLAAGPIADLLDQPQLAPILRVLSLALIFGGLSSVPEAILRRNLMFSSVAMRQLLGAACGGVAGLAAALAGAGVWSLVAQLLAQGAVGTVVLWLAVPWRPTAEVTWSHLKELIGFGSNILALNLMTLLNRQSDDFLIGVTLGVEALGYYTVGYRLLLLLTDVLIRTIDAVTLPTFARVQNQRDRLRRAYLMATHLSATVATPVFLGMAALAPELVELAFGPAWAPAVPVMQALAFIGILHANTFFNSSVLIAIGQPRKALFIGAINTVSNVIAFAVAVHWGILAVAIAYVVRGYLLWPISIVMVRRYLDFSFWRYLRIFAIPFGCSLLMAGVVLALKPLLSPPLDDAGILVVGTAVGAVAYAVFMQIAGREDLRELREFVGPAVPRLDRALSSLQRLRPRMGETHG